MSSEIETLFPFLYRSDPGAVMDEVRRSIVSKAEEIVSLREALLARYADDLTLCAGRMAGAFAAGGRLFAFGSGSSGTDAQALALLFAHPPVPARPVPATSLAQNVAVLTALANDIGPEAVFARQIAAFGRSGDIAIGLSTGGGSVDVLNALGEAGRRGMITVGLAGGDGGPMAQTPVDHMFIVPSASVHRVQEAQTTLYHVLWELTQGER